MVIYTFLLWFDVENKRYTTTLRRLKQRLELWFDVENKRYTTGSQVGLQGQCCGLM